MVFENLRLAPLLCRFSVGDIRFRRHKSGAKKMDKATILNILETNDRAVEKALVVLYHRQTASEKASNGITIESNGRGFNGRDGEFGSSLAKNVEKGWSLSVKQLFYGRKMVKKYWRQLLEDAEAEATQAQAQ